MHRDEIFPKSKEGFSSSRSPHASSARKLKKKFLELNHKTHMKQCSRVCSFCFHPRLVKWFSSSLISFCLSRQHQQQQPEHRKEHKRAEWRLVHEGMTERERDGKWEKQRCRVEEINKRSLFSDSLFISFNEKLFRATENWSISLISATIG